MSKDYLAEDIAQLIAEYDDAKELDEKEYRKIGLLVSALVRSDDSIRKLFYTKIKDVARIMIKKLNEKIASMEELMSTKKKIYN
jgi:hypothetical protein